MVITKIKYESITTSGVMHDAANMLTELILLNRGGKIAAFPWRSLGIKDFWMSTVAVLKKLIKIHGLSEDQLAFYIFKCRPTEISSQEFAKAAVVAKKLFNKFALSSVVEIYRREFKINDNNPVINAKAISGGKSLVSFLKELENAKK